MSFIEIELKLQNIRERIRNKFSFPDLKTKEENQCKQQKKDNTLKANVRRNKRHVNTIKEVLNLISPNLNLDDAQKSEDWLKSVNITDVSDSMRLNAMVHLEPIRKISAEVNCSDETRRQLLEIKNKAHREH